MRFVGLVIMLAGMAGLAAVAGPAVADGDRTIVVNGEAKLRVVPDIARVTVVVEVQAETEAEALDISGDRTEAVIDTLDRAGIGADDVQSHGVRLEPRYAEGLVSRETQIVGYSAINRISVRSDDVEGLGQLIADLVGAGANRVETVQFDIADREGFEDDARAAAVRDGRRRAEIYADAAAVDLGRLITLSESGSYFQGTTLEAAALDVAPVVMPERSGPSGPVPLSPGLIEVTVLITMVFEIGG